MISLDSIPQKDAAEESFMNRLRILVLGPDCNPEGISIPYVTYSHAAALAQLHDVTLVVRATVEELCAAQRRRFALSRWSGCRWLERIYSLGFSTDLQI